MAHFGKFIAYYRVSTQKQGRSGLGLEAQKQAVATYLNGGSWSIVAEFTEVESGKRDDNRPMLAEAFKACRVHARPRHHPLQASSPDVERLFSGSRARRLQRSGWSRVSDALLTRTQPV
jgi:hypothetical protein